MAQIFDIGESDTEAESPLNLIKKKRLVSNKHSSLKFHWRLGG